MNYIVLDLEWNQNTTIKSDIQEKLPFEIIEIGAVKLDEKRGYQDRFQELIKPSIYKELHPVVAEMLGITMDELNSKRSFTEVYEEFLNWCGENCIFCTWGNMDLYELQRNAQFFSCRELADRPFLYYDIQKLFALDVEGKKDQKTLEYAVDYLKIEKNSRFHRAVCDAEYTAEVFARLDSKLIKTFYSIDVYHYPKSREEELLLKYPTYTKYITREFPSKEAALADRKVKNLYCPKCGMALNKRIRWFTNNTKNYYSLGCCKSHGYVKGKLHFNRTQGDRVFVVKVSSELSQERAEKLKEYYGHVNDKKRERRKRASHTP